MTAGLVRDLFDYSAWANRRFLDALASLPEELVLRDLGSSHGGLLGTMRHVVFAQQVWLLRWRGEPIAPAYRLSESTTTLASVRTEWERVEKETDAFLSPNLTDGFLAGTFEARTTKGETFIHGYGDSMVHLVNHSSYHRGQLAGMMRQLGVKPPGTDYIVFVRERK